MEEEEEEEEEERVSPLLPPLTVNGPVVVLLLVRCSVCLLGGGIDQTGRTDREKKSWEAKSGLDFFFLWGITLLRPRAEFCIKIFFKLLFSPF